MSELVIPTLWGVKVIDLIGYGEEINIVAPSLEEAVDKARALGVLFSSRGYHVHEEDGGKVIHVDKPGPRAQRAVLLSMDLGDALVESFIARWKDVPDD